MRCEAGSRWSPVPPAAPAVALRPPSARPAPPSCAPGGAASRATRTPITTGPRPSRRRPHWSTSWAVSAWPPRSTTLSPTRCGPSRERLRTDYGSIDILVNDIWGAEVLKGPPATWNTPIWQHDLPTGLRILRLGVETHLITSHFLLPLLIARPGGLLVEVTDGTTDYNADELSDLGVLRPGEGGGEPAGVLPGTRTGRARRHGGGDHAGLAALGDDARQLGRARGELARRLHPAGRRLPRSPGLRARRRVRATSVARSRRWPADERRERWNQQSVTSAQMAREYGFTDIDGSRPDAWTLAGQSPE